MLIPLGTIVEMRICEYFLGGEDKWNLAKNGYSKGKETKCNMYKRKRVIF